MPTTPPRRFVIACLPLSALSIVIAFAPPLAAQTPRTVIEWGETTAAKLAEFIPASIDGLVDALPWDVEREWPEFNSGCPLGCLQFTPSSAFRAWRVADPSLAAQWERAGEKARADADALVSQFGKISEAEFSRRQKTIEDITRNLELRGRTVEMLIKTNMPPAPRGPEGRPVPAGSIKGLDVTRYMFDDAAYAPTSRGIRLVVFLGPAGFKNPGVRAETMQAGVKAISVEVSVQTLPEKAADDEALLRRLLERVGYDRLRTLLQ